MGSLSEIITRAMNARNIRSQSELSRLSGVPQPTISSIFMRNAASTGTLERLARVLPITVLPTSIAEEGELTGMVAYSKKKAAEIIESLGGEKYDKSKFSLIPLLLTIQSLAPGRDPSQEEAEEHYVRKRLVEHLNGDIYAAPVDGGDMAPELREGDIVVVDIKQRELRDLINKVCVVHTKSTGVIVRYVKLEGGRVYLQAPSERFPLVLSAREIRICGKVIGSERSWE